MQTVSFRQIFNKLNVFRKSQYQLRLCSTNSNVDISGSSATRTSSFSNPSTPIYEDEAAEFRYLLRYSNFINMGDPENKIVLGKIFHTVYDDLYIDFGWKFYCVSPRPSKDGELYVRGTEVLLRIKELELSSHFLGTRALTLLEANAAIVRLISSPMKKN